MTAPATEKIARDDLIKRLGSVPLFSGLDKKGLELVAKEGRVVTFPPGKTIFKEGEPGISFLMILDGKVEIRKKGKVLATLRSGQFFGEMTVIDDKTRSADAVALDETTCFGLTSWSFSGAVTVHPEIAIPIMRELVARLRKLEEETS